MPEHAIERLARRAIGSGHGEIRVPDKRSLGAGVPPDNSVLSGCVPTALPLSEVSHFCLS
jgi:hypothetical protein